jgi:aryl-alcohol dehydrogenase-like predicted oxidoreductase
MKIGLTVTGPQQAETIEQAVATDIFDVVQATWNVLEQSAGSAMASAHAAGLGVIVKEPLANGRLTDRGDQPRLVDMARSVGSTPDAVALSVVLNQPWTDVVLSGAATVKELQSNLDALVLQLDPQFVGRVCGLRQDSETYWKARAALPWN